MGRLAVLLRASLDTSNQPLIPLQQDLAMVESYLDIERARFGDKLRGSIEVPEELRGAKVPPMSVQALVENAVKHGIAPQWRSGKSWWRLRRQGQFQDRGSRHRARLQPDRNSRWPWSRQSSGAAPFALRRQGAIECFPAKQPLGGGDDFATRLKLRAYLVDDEPLALERLRRLLEHTERVKVIGSTTEPEEAVAALTADPPDVLLLGIKCRV